MQVNIHEAKTQLSRLLRRVAEGEEITISRAGVPVAKLIAAPPINRLRPLGAMEGKIYIAEDFDAPLPDDILASFYGEEPKRKKPACAKSVRPANKRVGR
ncbi:MAG: type II toxin-antitoxin system Phd/YefM family antitoxin [Terriglobales bacterium]|jgi:prevent-host-death family protein